VNYVLDHFNGVTGADATNPIAPATVADTRVAAPMPIDTRKPREKIKAVAK
jgi:hypothetical protein